MSIAPPLEHFYNLGRLSDAGAEIVIAAKAEDLARLAAWLGVDNVEKFEGRVALKKNGTNRYRYDAHLVSTLTQPSVVSLDLVQSRIDETFSRELRIAQHAFRGSEAEIFPSVPPPDDEGPEEIDNPNFDLAAPLLEELALALDPYPKAENEVFTAPEDLG